MFSVGQKVVCVDAKMRREYMLPHRRYSLDMDGLREGAIYTIREICTGDTNPIAFRLVEIFRGYDPDGSEAPYDARRFRPLIERKTDIGFAYEILRKASKEKPTPVKAFESSSWFGG